MVKQANKLRIFSKSKNNKTKHVKESYDCTYHGWVMVPMHLDRGRKLPFEDQSVMLKIGQKVAKSQVTTRPEGQASQIKLDSVTGFIIQGNTQKPQDQPLFKADIPSICSVLSMPELGCSVIMAFTEDSNGKEGVGCDVIRFNKNANKAIKVLKKYNGKIFDLFHCNKQSILSKIQDHPKSPSKLLESENVQIENKKKLIKKSKRRSSSHAYMDVCPNRKESVDISGTDGGYLTIEMVNSIVDEDSAYQEENNDNNDGGYLIVGRFKQKMYLPQSDDRDLDEFSIDYSSEDEEL